MFLAAAAQPPFSASAASPPAYVTRAAFAQVLAQDLHLPPTPDAPQAFPDLPQADPAYGPLMAVYNAGWISGYPDGTFRPNAPLTREQVAKAEIIALGLGGQAAGLADIRPAYRDSGDIGRWAYGYIDKATRIGILAGTTQGLFEPQANFTQAELEYAESRLTAYIAAAPVPELASLPSATAGPAVGTTSVAATPGRAGDRLAFAVSAAPLVRPTRLAALPQDLVTYAPGESLTASPGAYVGIYELTPGSRVWAFSSLRLSAAQVTGPPAGLRLFGPAAGPAQARAATGPFTLRLVDPSGNPTPAPPGGVTAVLAAGGPGTHLFALSQGGPLVTAVTIPPGGTGASFYYGATRPGTQVLRATAGAFPAATRDLHVVAGPPAAIVLCGPAQGIASRAARMGPFTLSLRDALGNPASAPLGGFPIALGSTSHGGIFALSRDGQRIHAVVVAAGRSVARFYYADAFSGDPAITAQAPEVPSVRQILTVRPATVTGMTLQGPASGAAGASVGPFTVTLTDAAGQIVPAPTGGITIALGSSSTDPHAFVSVRGQRVASVRIGSGGESRSFYYHDSGPGAYLLSASAPGVRAATREVDVAGRTPVAGRALDSQTAAPTRSEVRAWYSQGMRNIFLNTFAPSFAARYAASLRRLDVILFQGYWTPAFVDQRGAVRAQSAIRAAKSVGYPKGADIFVDIESTGQATARHMIAWINSWSLAVARAGYKPGVYFGVPQPVSARAAGLLLAESYWKSYSAWSITPAVHGTCAYQTHIYRALDTDWLGKDRLGRPCIGAGI